MNLDASQRMVNISLANIEDQTAALLYSFGAVADNEEISNIQFGEAVKGTEGQEVVPVTFQVKKREGYRPNRNGTEET